MGRASLLRPALALGLAVIAVFRLSYFEFGSLVTQSSSEIIQAPVTGAASNAPLAMVGGAFRTRWMADYVPIYSPLEWLAQGTSARRSREGWAYYRLWTLLLAPFGFVLLTRRTGGEPLALIGFAGLLTTLVFVLVGLGLDIYLRYALFALPFVAIGCGIVLDALIERAALRMGRCGLDGSDRTHPCSALAALCLRHGFIAMTCPHT